MFMNNKNSFQPVNNNTETYAITIPTKTQRIKQPRRQLVPESEKMKKNQRRRKNHRSFPNNNIRLTTSQKISGLSVTSETGVNEKPKKGCGFCGSK